jgi:hypothetical protein
MTNEAAFTEEEWIRVRRAPSVAGMAISLADPGGPIELSKETIATLKAVGAPPTKEELLVAVSQDVMSMTQRRENPIGDFKVQDAGQAGTEILAELRAAQDVVEAKATPEEAAAYARWLVDVAQDAANAAKEGGFLGIGAEQVSAGEQRMLDQLRSTLGVTD